MSNISTVTSKEREQKLKAIREKFKRDKERTQRAKVENLVYKSINDLWYNFRNRKRDLKYNTIKSYKERFNNFKKFLEIIYPDITIKEINSEVIEDYKIYLRGTCNNIMASVNTALRHIRPLIKLAVENGAIPTPVKFKLYDTKTKQYKAEIKSKKPLSEETIKALLEKPTGKEVRFSTYRDWVAINLIYTTGIRVGELTSIELRDVVHDSIKNMHYIRIRKEISKNHEERFIPLSDTIKEIILEYMKIMDGEPTDKIIASSWDYKEGMNTSTFTNRLKDKARKLNLDEAERVNAHLCRHTFANEWVNNQEDGNLHLDELQSVLGHKTNAMTQHYANMNGKEATKIVKRYDPLKRYKDRKVKKINL